MTPKEVLALCREKDVKAVDLRFMDFPGLWQHFTIPVSKLDEDVFEDGLGSTARASAAGRRSTRATCSSCRSPTRPCIDPVLHDPDAVDDLQHPGPDHPRGLHPRPAQRRPQGGQLPEEHRHRRHLPTSGRRPSSSSSTTSASTRRAQRGYYYIDSVEGHWNRGRDEKPEPRLQAPLQGRLLPRPAGRSADGHPQRDDADDDRLRHERRGPAPRSRHRRAVRNRHEVRPRW